MTDVLTAKYFCDIMGVSSVESMSIKKSNSLEGEIEEYGQKSITTTKRNLLNVDEILRMPTNKLIVNLRGNKPLLLDKTIYTEHSLFNKLKDSSVLEYNPKWAKNSAKRKTVVERKTKENETKKEKITWENF